MHWAKINTPKLVYTPWENAMDALGIMCPMINLVPRVFSLFKMAAAREKTLAHSDLKRSLIGAILT